MNGWLFIGIGLSIFLGLLVLTKKQKQVFDYLLLSWLFLNGLYLGFLYLNFSMDTEEFEHWLIPFNFLPLLTVSLLYFYVVSLISRKPFRILKFWFHFLPFFWMTGAALWCYWQYGQDSLDFYDGVMLISPDYPYYLRIYGLVIAFFAFLYPMICLFLLFKHRQKIKLEFSFKESITLNWLRRWIVLEIVAFWISFAIIWAGNFRWIGFLQSFQTVGGLIIFNMAFIGFFGLRQTVIFQEKIMESPKKKSKAKDYDQIIKKLEAHIQRGKPHLNPKLTIQDLALEIDESRHSVSAAINRGHQKNFYDYVNGLRVEEFKIRILNPQNEHLSLLGVALDSGFNSKSTFNTIFKNHEGITPSEYRKKMKEKSPN